jgi:hypothetical protein
MKIQLNRSQSFWGLMNPKDLKLTLNLTSENPTSAEINLEKLHVWEIKQILGSLKSEKISISVKPQDLIELIPQDQRGKTAKKLKPTSKVATIIEKEKVLVSEPIKEGLTAAISGVVDIEESKTLETPIAKPVKASKKKTSKKVAKKIEPVAEIEKNIEE